MSVRAELCERLRLGLGLRGFGLPTGDRADELTDDACR